MSGFFGSREQQQELRLAFRLSDQHHVETVAEAIGSTCSMIYYRVDDHPSVRVKA